MPKRSTGCLRCRQRKVKCDETRPSCSTCVHRGEACPGYTTSNSFVFKDQTKQVAARVSTLRPQALPHGEPDDHHSVQSGAEVVPQPRPYDIDTTREFRALLFSNFLATFLPRNDSQSSGPFYAYLRELFADIDGSSTLPAAVDAISLAQLGHHTRNNDILARAVTRYGDALAGVSRTLSSNNLQKMLSVQATIQILAQSEFFVVISLRDGWYKHSDAITRLFLLRGPASVVDPLSKSLYRSARHSAIHAGFVRRKALPYAAPMWLALTREEALDNPATALSDILVHVPGALEAYDSAGPDNNAKCAALLLHHSNLNHDLDAWLRNVEAEQPNLYWRVPSIDLVRFREQHSEFLPEAYQFPSFSTALMLTCYWVATFLLIRDMIDLMQRSAAEEASKQTKTRQLTARMHETILKLCLAIPYLFQPEVGTPGRTAILIPWRIVREYFQQTGNQRALIWCEAVTEELRKCGIVSPSASAPKK